MGKQSLGRVLASTTCIIALMLACSSTHESEDVGVAREALSGTGGSKATGGTKSTGGKSGTGGAKTGGTSSTGGSKATGGKSGTGGSKTTGGSSLTGGKSSTGGTKSTGGAPTGGKPATGGGAAGGLPATGGTTSLGCIPANCNDNNSCTVDSCVAGVCGHVPLADGTTCSDGNACTASDQCQFGTCQSGAAVGVDDGDPCTTDSCDPITGVKHVPVTTDPKCAMWNSGALKVEVKTNYCDAQKVQQYFQVTNTGSSAVNLSDVTIKYWVDDTTGGHIVSDIYYGGCVVVSPSNLTCLHTVTAVAATGTSITACASDPTHQANWEVAVGTTDSTTLQPGQQWNNIQTVVHLDTWASFVPGTNQWYSTCLANPGFVADGHFAVFYKGNLVYSSGINAPDCAAPHGSQRLSGYMVPAVSNAPIMGSVPPATVVRLPFGVPSQNLTGLQQLAQQVSDPTNPKYRAYVPPQDFSGLYGGLPGNYSGLSGILAGKGLTLVETYPNNLLMTISGTAAAFGQAMYANLVYRQRADGSQFVSVDRDPSLDSPYPVSWISGLDESQAPRGSYGSGPPQPNCSPGANGISCNLYWGSDYRNAYVASDGSGNCPSADTLRGTDQYLGIIGPVDYLDDDINYFKGPNGIQLLRDVPVTRVIRGQPPGTDFGFDPGTRETDIDIEAALSIAPDLKQVYVFESTSFPMMFHAAATTVPLANQVSSSWQFSTDLNVQVALLQMAAQGQSYFQASGDDGKSPPQNTLSPNDIREADWVTVVGGTELTLNSTLTGYASEIPWSGSVGGFAPDRPLLPAYQSGMDTQLALAGGSTSHRNFPDVAMVATHGAVYYSGVWNSFDGTSLSTPLWAGFMALVNEQAAHNLHGPVGFANLGIYQLAKDTTQNQQLFHDGQPPPGQTISSLGSQGLYNNAIGGFDLVTGWGSPTCALIAALANTSQSPMTCPSGQSLCWGGCVDVQTDPHNCGVCGFDCGAGQRTDVGNLCVSGTCQPFTVKSKTGVSRIAVDSSYVYVSTLPSAYGAADGALWSTTQEGLVAWNLLASNQATINNLVQDSSTTYWSTFGTASGAGNFNPDGSVMAKSFFATASTTLSSVSGLGQLGNLAVGGGSVFFPTHTISGVQPDYTQGSLMTVPGWTNTGFTPAVPATLFPTLQGIDLVTVDSKATNVFWASLKDHSAAMVAEALVCGGANSAWISQYYQSVLDSVSASASFSGGTIYASAVNSTAITTVATGQSPVSLAMRSEAKRSEAKRSEATEVCTGSMTRKTHCPRFRRTQAA